MMYVFNTCADWLRTVPNLPYSQTKMEDVDTRAEDHEYDSMRYFFMSRPLAATKCKPPKPKTWDPYRRDEE